MKSLPFCDDVVEVLKDDFADGPVVFGRHVIGKSLTDFESVNIQPILAIHLRLAGMDMNRFMAFIRVKEETPPGYEQYGWHEA
jgi:hypothetical protein